jgi:hypothetical protein
MYPPPAGEHLTSEQARELDDTFLSSDPFGYFRSRIASLLAWQENAPVGDSPLPTAVAGDIRAEFNHFLRRPAADGPFRDLDVHAQVAADALSLRHHAAEALVRLTCARLAPVSLAGAPCLWVQIVDGPRWASDVSQRLSDFSSSTDAGERMLRALVPPDELEAAQSSAEVVDAANVMVSWLQYAVDLLTPAEIDLQAAHNKVKHGLAVRARADMRITFSTRGPNDSGEVPLSALSGDGAIDIFDQPVLELLAHAPAAGRRRGGLEATQVRIKPSAVLAETFMMAMMHGALFHVAAAEHFAGREDLREHHLIPAHPGWPVGGPRPEHIDAGASLGMRHALTTPGDGSPPRPTGIGFRDGFLEMAVNYEGRMQGRVVDG